MKKVLLLGDSIRMGYDDYVKEELKEFEVFYDPEDNGRFSDYTIWMFNFYNNTYGPFDVVHFNCGYWDMHIECPNNEREVPIEDYTYNLKRLIRYIKSTGAIPIFATTTPIYDTPEKDGEFVKIDYKNAWVNEYNDAALKIMKEENVLVDDLYSLLLDESKRYYKCQDSLHLTDEGYRKCAKEVARVIRSILNP